MPWSTGTTRTDIGELAIAGLTASQIAAEVGTPVYVIDLADLLARSSTWRDEFASAFNRVGSRARVFYGGKAFLSVAVARWLYREGLGIDAATGGELAVLLKAGVPGTHIGLHGNNKSDAEIARALDVGVAHLVIDSLDEVDRVAAVASKRGERVVVMVWVTLGIKAGAHEHLSTSHADQKFGLAVADGSALAAIRAILASPDLELRGLHSHLGSQILAPEVFAAAAGQLSDVRAEVYQATGYVASELNFGGGFGVAYLPNAPQLAPRDVATAMAEAVRESCSRHRLAVPDVSIEPGRAIIGPTTTTLYRVGTVKPVTLPDGGSRLYVSVDGGMSDNIRTALYDADYHAELANRTSSAPKAPARVVGKHCETGDIVVRDVALPSDIAAGDLLAVPVTGAYGRSMASNYNMVPRPPVVAVRDGVLQTLVRRETEADLLALDLSTLSEHP